MNSINTLVSIDEPIYAFQIHNRSNTFNPKSKRNPNPKTDSYKIQNLHKSQILLMFRQ